jgi:hypothetical protein
MKILLWSLNLLCVFLITAWVIGWRQHRDAPPPLESVQTLPPSETEPAAAKPVVETGARTASPNPPTPPASNPSASEPPPVVHKAVPYEVEVAVPAQIFDEAAFDQTETKDIPKARPLVPQTDVAPNVSDTSDPRRSDSSHGREG